MSAITTKFVTDHELTNEMSLEELSRYAPEILELLPADREKRRQARDRHAPEILELLPADREKRRQARDHLQKGYNFSKEQAFALIPSQRTGRTKSQVTPKEEGQKRK